MFGVGLWEVVLIVVVALLVLGPEKLPGVAQQLGRGLRDLRRTAADLQASLHEAMSEAAAEASASGRGPALGGPGAALVLTPASGAQPRALADAGTMASAALTAAEAYPDLVAAGPAAPSTGASTGATSSASTSTTPSSSIAPSPGSSASGHEPSSAA